MGLQDSWGNFPGCVSQTGHGTPGKGAVPTQKKRDFPGFVMGFLGGQMRWGEGDGADA